MEQEEMEIDLLALAKALWRRAWAIILAMVIMGGVFFGYTYMCIDPTYESSALIYVNNSTVSVGSVSISATELSAAKTLVQTYIVILKSRTVLEDVIAETGVDYTYEELYDMIEAKDVNSTEIFEVKVTSTDPEEAETIANTIAIMLPEKIAAIVDGSSVRIVDYAIVPSHRAAPSYTKNTAIGIVLGFVLSCAVIICMELFDETVRSEDYLTQNYPDIPLLAVVPDMDSSKNRNGYGYGYGYDTGKTAKGGKK